ncbi:MAG TPA: 4'-phosphopantetheinyl transferase superfamily protein [Clostridia bacterium]|nr:4'-phosphopantetheinyl transferase superfamily protein [Clostridia bacterium]
MITVYVLRTDRDLSQNEYCYLSEMVSSDKHKQLRKFSRYEDAQRTLLGDVLLRCALKERYGMLNSEIVFRTNEFGKPYLQNCPDNHINISHSKKYVACAVSLSPVGIDVEEIGNMDINTVNRFFTEEEKQYILGFPKQVQSSAFYHIWTRKEAYIKREGKGLQTPLSTINVLGPIDNTYFHLIFKNYEAICNVCSCESILPTISYPTLDSLFHK